MSALMITIAAVIVAWVLAYYEAGTRLWTIFAAALLGAVLYASGAGQTAWIVSFAVLAVPAIIMNIKALRSSLLTAPIFKGFKAVLPPMTSTEREALEAGDVWWDAEMFRGRPQWNKLLVEHQAPEFTKEEQDFMDNQVNTLCSMLDDWAIEFEQKDLPAEVWDYMRKEKFFAMLISKEWGGLGFSAFAQSAVVTKIATRSLSAAVTAMVPNSLGPGELLMHYGTDEQKKYWLPGLADGTHIPCFGLTGPEAGSDAGAIPDIGFVCEQEFEGKKTLGIRLTFAKRWITLAPVATVVGLAFKLQDPDGLLGDPNKSDYGITCALIPSDHPGVEIGRRHYPGAFMNGPINGTDVFIPVDWIIGGAEKAGGGWRMLVECLSAGRGISLPALSAAASKVAYRMTGAHSRLRRQFKTPIGLFEGVQEANGRIAGLTYKLEAMRTLTASAVDVCSPSVITAMAKYHMTEMMRVIVNDSMDVLGGRAVQMGPRNYVATGYHGIPIAITVEGANILTRNLMIFGQGAIRCHPYVFPEMEAARDDNLSEFDKLLWGHIGYSANRGIRSFTYALTGSAFANTPVSGPMAKYYKQLTRMSSALAFVSDVTMGVLGGDLKRKENLSARLGDVLSQLYMASAVLKYFYDNGETDEDLPHAEWAVQHSLYEIQLAFDGFFANFPNRLVARFMKLVTFPTGRSYKKPADELHNKLALMMMEPTALRDRLTKEAYFGSSADDVTGRMECAYNALIKVEPVYNRYMKAFGKGKIEGLDTESRLKDAVEKQIVTQEEADQIAEFDKLRYDAILTDAFEKEYLIGAEVEHVAGQKVA
ncbi:acyl-coenzyme A dehydrogenase [gamma proteobacterium HTCC5015]|nr:acyl-coenzyme A dehydrogenase [gamma proteobacterium HTCC5015]